MFAGVLIVNSILKFTRFSFILTDRTVTIDSGVFFQSTRVIRFDKIQDVEAKRGLLLMLLGLKSVAIWTASLDQVRGNTRRPDGLIVLDTDTADWLANFLSDPDTHRNTPPEDADRADMQPTMRSRTGNFGALFGFASVVLLGVIAWGLWSKSGGTPPATVAAAAPSGTAATAA
ncbi:MAG: PH domain-containing protein, partial [Steroidobacteraceae bacterium]